MKVRVKRVKRSDLYIPIRFDLGFKNAVIDRLPKVGEPAIFRFDRLGYGICCTSKVLQKRRTKTLVVLKTENSTYHLKKGWKP